MEEYWEVSLRTDVCHMFSYVLVSCETRLQNTSSINLHSTFYSGPCSRVRRVPQRNMDKVTVCAALSCCSRRVRILESKDVGVMAVRSGTEQRYGELLSASPASCNAYSIACMEVPICMGEA